MPHPRNAMLVTLIAAGAASAAAQMPSMPSMGGMKGMPNISGMGMNNAAGVLSYCTQNKLLGSSSGASSVLQGLEKKPGVTSSKEFKAGKAGNILGASGHSMSLSSISGPAKSHACDMVLKQAKHFL